jgi:DNA-binding transcriptional MocR family regulator
VVEGGLVDRQVEAVRGAYRARRDALLQGIEEHFPEGVAHTWPQGGMFVWAELPRSVDATALLGRALERHVAFVPGRGFHPDGTGANTMRLNFSMVTPEKLRHAAAQLGLAIQGELERAERPSLPIAV